jgi:hypothetical protein
LYEEHREDVPVLDANGNPVYNELGEPEIQQIWRKYILRKVPGTFNDWTRELVPTAVIENYHATEDELTEYN